MGFCNFCYYFWGQHCRCTDTSISGNDFFFISSITPLPLRCSGVPARERPSLAITHEVRSISSKLRCTATRSLQPLQYQLGRQEAVDAEVYLTLPSGHNLRSLNADFIPSHCFDCASPSAISMLRHNATECFDWSWAASEVVLTHAWLGWSRDQWLFTGQQQQISVLLFAANEVRFLDT